ncbi:MAG: type II toxin-antitoxin system Phd/YefM family antitoxin [Sulfobacillus sp.]|nr:type II toxin-antitoxin system Phd/YefM family antitoxin [Sulfobacillus sp.]
MRLVSVRDLRTQTRRISEWLATSEEIVVTSNGKPIGILSPVTEDSLEFELLALRQVRAVRALNRLQELSHQSGLDQLSDEDIAQEIVAARRSNRDHESRE